MLCRTWTESSKRGHKLSDGLNIHVENPFGKNELKKTMKIQEKLESVAEQDILVLTENKKSKSVDKTPLDGVGEDWHY